MSQSGRNITNSGPGGFIQTLTGNSGGAVGPTGGNINVVGSGNINVAGNAGTSTETITLVGTTTNAVQIGNVSGSLTSLAVGTNGQVLIGATGAAPAFATLTSSDSSITFTLGANSLGLTVTGGTTVGKTITGNTGGALSPTAGNWNIVTANSNIVFAGAVSTETLDFALTNNLLLGSPGSITIGSDNVGYGKLAAASITSGSENTFIGYESGVHYTTGSDSTAVGAFSMFSAVAGASSNTAIGYSSLYNLAGLGSGNIAIGVNSATAYTTTESNNIIIGSLGTVADTGKIRIGTNGAQTATFIAGIDGVNVGSVAKVVTLASDQLGTAIITAGLGISITPGANTITIAATGSGFTWFDVTTGSATLAAESGYIADKNTLTTFTMPTNNAFGDTIKIVGKGTGLWKIVYGAGQNIVFGSTTSTTTTGNITSTNAGDCVELVCTTASATAPIFTVVNCIGNPSIT